jgi:putative copper resistance protein D
VIGLTIIRAIHFAFAVQAIGALLFVWIVGRTGGGATPGGSDWPRFMRVAVISVVAAILSEVGWFILQVADMADGSVADAWTNGMVGTVLFKTHAGIIWWVRFAIAASLMFSVALLAASRRAPGPIAVGSALILAAANFVSGAWLSHAAADPSPLGWLHLAIHALHMLGVSLWLGGLLPLAMLLARAQRSGDQQTLAVAQSASIRFGNIALLAVGLILLTGIANTALVMESISDVTSSTYGRLLVTKLILALLMLVLAANNRQWLVPRLSDASSPHAAARLRWSVLGELALGALILLVAGALGLSPPGAED